MGDFYDSAQALFNNINQANKSDEDQKNSNQQFKKIKLSEVDMYIGFFVIFD